MSARLYRSRFGRPSSWFPILCVCSLLETAGGASVIRAQDNAVADAIAGVLRVEDARVFDVSVLGVAALHPEAIVRRRAALAIGRIGNTDGTAILLELLEDPAEVVRQDAAFALGLLGDRSAIPKLREVVLGASPDEQSQTHVEAVSAIARIHGRDASVFFDELFLRWVGRAVAGEELPSSVIRALQEAWRLEEEAPVHRLAQYAESPRVAARFAALYSLGRLRSPAGANAFIRGLRDEDRFVRAISTRALTAEFVDSAGLDRGGTAGRIVALLDDPDSHVRINALRSLGTYEDPAHVGAVAKALSDSDPNVRMQALAALGYLGGAEAAGLLYRNVDRGTFAERRQALSSLARADRDRALVVCAGWIIAEDFPSRFAGIEALETIGGDTARAWIEGLISDSDARITARAFSALEQVDSLLAVGKARELLLHSDPVVRAMAASVMENASGPEDTELLSAAYELSLSDDESDARVALVSAIGTLAQRGAAERAAVREAFLQRHRSSDDYLVRRAAIDNFPAAAELWGEVAPIETGRSPEDYRDVARRLVIPAELHGELPQLVIQTEQGEISISLYAADAPITVDALLQLADRNYFDGGAWHRVVPNFVVQDGDPRGDGWGNPGFTLRDENSRRRYGRGTVGLALSGPDTGGSQFFITHSAQPHLNGTYPVIGQVEQGMDVVDRIARGDRIRTIRRR